MSSASATSAQSPLFLGLDLSTQQLKLSVISTTTPSDRTIVYESAVHFDRDLPQYGTKDGSILRTGGVAVCPTACWVEAMDLCFERMAKELGKDGIRRIKGIGGAAQQHGSVYLTSNFLPTLTSLSTTSSLSSQLVPAVYSRADSPIWQDSSTTRECRELEEAVGGAQALSDKTGSRAYERFTGTQIRKLYKNDPETYARTAHITLISSFLHSLLLQRLAPPDQADASGMNLMDIDTRKWDDQLLRECGGDELRSKLGDEPVEGGKSLGGIGRWWQERFGFEADCAIAPFTGDNPASLILITQPSDALVSLGTSSTLLITLPPSPSPARTTTSHLLAHPTMPGGYMGMLCFKNGSLTRQNVRDQSVGKSWDAFDDALKRTNPGNGGRLGFYFDLKEIIPDGVEGTFRFVRGEDGSWKRVESFEADDGSADVRAVVEGQFLSMRSRTAALLPHQGGKPRRIIATGGTSSNRSVLQILADVMDADVYCYTSTAGATIGGAVLGMMAYRQSQGGAREDAADVVDDAAEERGLKLMVRPNAEAVKVYDALLPQWEKAEALVVEACR